MQIVIAARVKKALFKCACVFLFGTTVTCSAVDTNAPLKNVQQLVLVTSDDWNTVAATLCCFERTSESAAWRQVGEKIPVVLGRNGLGWGCGLHDAEHLIGPSKKEGDGRSPAGVFRLTSAFGLPERETMTHLKLPYIPLTDALECVDDVESVRYNSIVDREKIVNPDWTSSEKMKAIGEQYRLGVFVEHNTSPRQAGRGSCIFLHIWSSPKTGTSGCTAMAPEKMEQLLRWLDAAKAPILVQLPVQEFQRLRVRWQLPGGNR